MFRYQGRIDNRPTANAGEIVGARNHVTAVLAEIKAGEPFLLADGALRPW